MGGERDLAELERFSRLTGGEKQTCIIATDVIHVRMLRGENIPDRQRARIKRTRARKVTLAIKQGGEIVERYCCAGMLGTERLLVDRQSTLKDGARPRKVALGLKQRSEAVEARRRIGVLGTERLLVDRQRALQKRARPRKSPWA